MYVCMYDSAGGICKRGIDKINGDGDADGDGDS